MKESPTHDRPAVFKKTQSFLAKTKTKLPTKAVEEEVVDEHTTYDRNTALVSFCTVEQKPDRHSEPRLNQTPTYSRNDEFLSGLNHGGHSFHVITSGTLDAFQLFNAALSHTLQQQCASLCVRPCEPTNFQLCRVRV